VLPSINSLIHSCHSPAEPAAAEDPDSSAIDDPVWGRFETPAGKPFRPHTLLCIAICPCCVPPICTGPRKSAWRRAALSASFVLAYIQILLWIASLFLRGFAPASVNPMLGPWPDTLDLFQAKNAAEIVYNKQLWRLVMPIFLHAGLIHLATNMAMQLRMGITLEYEWGALRYLIIYMSSGIFASVYSAVMKPDQLSVGASGALMGVFGAWVSFLLASWSEGDDTAQRQRGFQFVMAVANIMVIIGFSFVPYVDWAAHVFGLLGGMLLGAWFFAVRPACETIPPGASSERPRSGPAPLPINNASRATMSPIAVMSARRRLYLAYASLVVFLMVLLAGLLGLFFNSTPDRALLDFCESMRAAYPSYALTC
jgi:membrane associated rhomboid family serine protease